MLSRLVDCLRLVVRIHPLVSVPVSGDRYSVSYSPLCSVRRDTSTRPHRSVVIGKRRPATVAWPRWSTSLPLGKSAVCHGRCRALDQLDQLASGAVSPACLVPVGGIESSRLRLDAVTLHPRRGLPTSAALDVRLAAVTSAGWSCGPGPAGFDGAAGRAVRSLGHRLVPVLGAQVRG